MSERNRQHGGSPARSTASASLGQPDGIATAAVFLASDAARFMTGADLLVDRGYNAV